MDLPNYFLADLPPEAELSPGMIREACQTLKRNRARYFVDRSTRGLVELLCGVARDWLDPEFPLRKEALAKGPIKLGLSGRTLTLGLEAFFQQWTEAGFKALIEQDLGEMQKLHGFSAAEPEQKAHRASLAKGPLLAAHITAGNLPCPALTSIALGILTRSAQFVKCATGTSLLPRLFAHSLYQADSKLGACLEIAEWKGGHAALEKVLYAEADCVTATGSDEVLAAVHRELPTHVRFVGYGHRVSFGYIAAEAFAGGSTRRLVDAAAIDVTAWNQLGCLSPHVIYVQEGGMVGAEKFAELLAEELARREETNPRGEVPVETAGAIASRRAIYEVRAAHSPETRHWCSQGSTAWTVVYEADPQFQLSCLNRFIYVKSVRDLTDMLQGAEAIRGKTSTVGIATAEGAAERTASELARWGASRVCPLGQMQNPPLAWRHDGRPALGDLVTWTDWERFK